MALARLIGDLLRRVKHKFRTALHLARTDRKALFRVLCGEYRLYTVFAAYLSEVAPPEPARSIRVQKLSPHDIIEIATRDKTLQYHQDRLEEIGVSQAYGIFSNESLAHICWLMTEQEDKKLRVRLVRLGPAEAEITHAFTLPEFRGRGVYPLAIRAICAIARDLGLERVFMIVRRGNIASRRGIAKAGLRPQGWIMRIIPPLFPSACTLITRWFRRRWERVGAVESGE